MSWVEWRDEYLPRCPACRSIYAERTPPEKPPCHQCRVDLLEENAEAAEVYLMCRGQTITRSRGMEGDIVTDISIPAVKSCMDALSVTDQRDCLRKVYKAFHEVLSEARG